MAFPSTVTLYTFHGVSFARILDGDSFQPWTFLEAQYTKDAVLGGSVTYLDIGAFVAPPLSFRAAFAVGADRVALKAALGVTDTLSNARGRSDTMTLVKVTSIDGLSNQIWADLTFELRPT
jgi:hypothetical protein